MAVAVERATVPALVSRPSSHVCPVQQLRLGDNSGTILTRGIASRPQPLADSEEGKRRRRCSLGGRRADGDGGHGAARRGGWRDR